MVPKDGDEERRDSDSELKQRLKDKLLKEYEKSTPDEKRELEDMEPEERIKYIKEKLKELTPQNYPPEERYEKYRGPTEEMNPMEELKRQLERRGQIDRRRNGPPPDKFYKGDWKID